MTKRPFSSISEPQIGHYRKYVREIASELMSNDKFKLTRFQGTFTIDNIETDKPDDIERLLRILYTQSSFKCHEKQLGNR